MATVRDLLVRIRGDDAELEKALSNSVRNLDAVGRRVERIGRDLTLKFTAPLVAAGGVAAKFATDFDREMTKIVTLVGVAEDQVEDWRKSLLELGPAVGKTPQELAEALFVVTSAGARGAEALQILERAAKASAAGLGDTTAIARTVTAAMTAYSSTGLTAARATDILVATVREGNLEAEALAGSLGRVLGTAADVGVTFDQVGAFVATFTRLGVGAEEAVVALRGVLSTIQKPTTGAEEALKSMGLSVEELRVSIVERGLVETLVNLVRRSRETGVEIAAVVPNVRALAGVLGTAGVQAEEFGQIADNISGSLGILDDAFERIQQTPAQTFAQLRASVAALAIAIGDGLAPTISELVRGMLPLLRTLRELDTETIRVIARTLAWAAAIPPLLMVMGTLARTGASVAQALIMVRTAGIALGTTLLPAGAVMVGLGLLAKMFIDARLEAVRAAVEISRLRSEIAAMGAEDRRELGLSRALGIIQAEEDLERASRKLEELQQKARRSRAFATGMVAVDPGIQEAQKEVDRLTDQIQQWRRELEIVNEVQRRSAESTRQLAAEQAEAAARAQAMMDDFERLGRSTEEAGGKIRTAADIMADLEQRIEVARTIGALSDAFDANQLSAQAMQSALQELASIGLGETDESVQNVAGRLNTLREEMAGVEQILQTLNDRLEHAERLGDVAGGTFDAQALSASAYEAALQALVDRGLDRMSPAVQQVAADLALLREDMENAATTTARMSEAQAVLASLIAASRSPAEEYLATMDLLELTLDGSAEAQERFNIAAAEARRRLEESEEQAQRTGQAWEDQFASAVVAATGRVSLNFKSMADDIVRQIARVMARLAAMRAMMAILSPFSGGAGLGATLFEAFAAPFGGAKASGGPVQARRTYLVGERGPELFQPAGAGTIIPNHALAGAGAGGAGPSPGAVAAEILSRLPRVPDHASPEVAATDDWYRRLISYAMADFDDRGGGR